ncbi:MAG: ComEC/Rec2 family competence protein, partial [Shewanella sp.]
MIALSSVLLLAIWFVTGQFSWLLVVVASAALMLLYYRQWLELGIMLFLCSQLFLMGSVEVLTEKQAVQQAQFTIISMPTMTTNGCRAYAKTASGEQWLVTVRTQAACPLIYGAKTVAQVIPAPISGLQNFHLFNRQQFYYNQKRIRGELQVQQLETATVIEQRYQQQTALLNWLERRINNPQAVMLFKTMVLGETSQFDEDVRETWQSLNISHILAISGLHAAIFIACIRSLCMRLTILKHYQPWIIGGLLLILRWYNFASVSFSRVVCMWFIHLLLGKRWSQ